MLKPPFHKRKRYGLTSRYKYGSIFVFGSITVVHQWLALDHLKFMVCFHFYSTAKLPNLRFRAEKEPTTNKFDKLLFLASLKPESLILNFLYKINDSPS